LSGKKTNFTTFGPHLENFGKNPIVDPMEIILPTPMNQATDLLCNNGKGMLAKFEDASTASLR